MKVKLPLITIIFFSLIVCSCTFNKVNKNNTTFSITFSDSLYTDNVSGKLILLISPDTSQSLIYGVIGDVPHPVFTYDIKNWDTNDILEIDNFDNSWTQSFNELKGTFAARLIFDYDTIYRSSFVTKDNGYSAKKIIHLNNDSVNNIEFNISKKFKGWEFNATNNIREIRMKSEKLSQFWGFDMYIEAAAVLPDSYYESANRSYPLVFVFPGFGSHHASITYGDGQINRYGMNKVGEKKIFIFCNGEFRNGYHHFADSENNGPWGKAFIQEFIPYIEHQFRVQTTSNSRFLMGQSSGAWTSAWLIVNYPEFFSAAFIASPDPLDFRALAHNIYSSESNFYYPKTPDSLQIEKGNNDKQWAILEDVLDEYGQIRTWESTYSPKGKNGKPINLFDRQTGKINQAISDYWKNYDINIRLKSIPEYYRKNLQNKLYFFVSEDDPYNLQKSIHMLEGTCNDLKIKADFNYFKDLGHNVWTDEMRAKIHAIIDSMSTDIELE